VKKWAGTTRLNYDWDFINEYADLYQRAIDAFNRRDYNTVAEIGERIQYISNEMYRRNVCMASKFNDELSCDSTDTKEYYVGLWVSAVLCEKHAHFAKAHNV
jgi:hypothetical protein